MSKRLQQLLILLISINLFGCGYFSDEPVEDADTAFVANVLEGNCDIKSDAEQISKLFDENIGGSLNCLRKGLKTYTEVSRRENPSFITLSELTEFIDENLDGTSSTLRDKLSLFFRLGNLLLNEPRDSLSVKNIDSIFDLLQVLNIEAMQLKNAALGAEDKIDGKNFLYYSRNFSRALTRLVDFYSPIVSANLQTGKTGHAINLKKFILDIFEGNSFIDFEIDGETIDAILGFKVLFVGGDQKTISSEEMLRFLEVSPDLVTPVFNLYFANEEDLGSQANQLVYFQKNLNEIAGQMYEHGERTIITTQKDIDHIFDKYFNEMESIDFLRPTVKELKNKLIDGRKNYSNTYTFQNVRSLFSLADIGLDAYLYYLNNESFFANEEPIRTGFTTRGRLSKQDFTNSTSNLAQTLRLKITEQRIFPSEVEYFEFFKFLNKEMEEIDIDEKVLDAAVGFKTLLMGGEKEITNRDEILLLLDKLRELGNLYYDLSSIDLETMTTHEILEMGLKDVRTFRNIIEVSASYNPVLNAQDIVTIIEYASNDGTSYQDYVPLIDTLKNRLIKGCNPDELLVKKDCEEHLTVKDFISTSNLFEGIIEKLYFAEVTFDLINPARRQKNRIEVKQSELQGSDYLNIPLANQVEYLKEFNHILNTYRYYRDDSGYSYYDNKIHRHSKGLIEIIAVKWAADLLLPIYGEKPELTAEEKAAGVVKDWVLTKDKLDAVLIEFKPVLETFKMWTQNIKTFGRNILLLADLFQEQSDGTLDINAVEIAEYGGLVFMAVQIGEEMMRTMIDKGYCENKGTEEDKILENDCFRKYYFKTLMVDLGMKNYMTKLYDYVVSHDNEEVMNFLKSVEGFTRDASDVQTSERMAKIIFGAMLNIESTLIRFDVNQDNILDFKECENGYEIYDDAVISLSGLDKLAGGNFLFLAPKAYFYMIDKMTLPPEGVPGGIVLTAYFYPKRLKAKRLNVGKLLEGIIEQANAQAEKEDAEKAEAEAN